MSPFSWITPGRRRCPAAWKLTRFASAGVRDPEIERHLASCSTCAAEHASLIAVTREALRLPAPPGMSDESRDAISARLLRADSPPPLPVAGRAPARRIGAWTAAGVVCAIAIGAVVFRDRGGGPPRQTAPVAATPVAATPVAATPVAATPAPSRASVRAIGSARFARVQAPPDEVVRLEDGRIELDVVPLAPGERFRVTTDSGEVEVRGTSFDVLATQGRLTAVSVSRGRVEVRSGGGLAVLDAGDRWVHASPAAPGPARTEVPPGPARTEVLPGPARTEVPPPRPLPPARALPPSRPRASRHASAVENALFDAGWSELRAGNARDAATTFAELERRARGHAIEEDALYWRAVAVARCKETAAAGRLFREFLARFPVSARRGEAAVALGWILLDEGSVDEARRSFEHAASDPASSVRASAAEGIRRTTRP